MVLLHGGWRHWLCCRGELDQWIASSISGSTRNSVPTTIFCLHRHSGSGEDYNIGADLVWVVRPAIDPAGDGAFDPNDASDDWDRDENDDKGDLGDQSSLL